MLHLCTSIQVASSILRIVFCFKFLPGFSVPESTLLRLWEESWRTLCCLVRARVCCLLSVVCFFSQRQCWASQLHFLPERWQMWDGLRCEMELSGGKWKNRTILKQMGMKSRKVRENQASQASQATLDSHVTFLDAWDGGTPGWGPSSSAP